MACSSLYLRSFHPVQEIGFIGNGFADIRVLGTLVAPAKKHDQRLSMLKIVHSIPRPDINAHFRNAVSTRLMVAVIALGRSVNPSQNGNPGVVVSQDVHPFLIWVNTACGGVVNYLHRA
jgi:hypothetical protein